MALDWGLRIDVRGNNDGRRVCAELNRHPGMQPKELAAFGSLPWSAGAEPAGACRLAKER